MAWSLWGLAVQIVAGSHAVASAVHEHRFGFIGHSVAGSGSLNPATPVDLAVIYALSGAVAGAILMFAVGFVVQSLRRKI